MRLKFLLLSSLICPLPLLGVCENYLPSRSDNIPIESVENCSDTFMEGYVQALLDMHYYEFQVKVVVRDRCAYLFDLPNNDLFAESISTFVCDIPGICLVKPVDCCFQDYLASQNCGYDCYFEPSCCPCDSLRGIWFPQTNLLFSPFIADPRTVTNSAALRFNDDVVGKHAGAVSFGDQFIVYRFRDVLRWHGDLECGIEAGIFATFDLDHPKACMFNTDFFVAALFDYAVNKWSWRFRLWHLSSHVGDEFLISNPGFERKNLSDNGVDLFASYQICRPIRLYAGGGYIFDRDAEFPQHPWYMEWGTEVRLLGERDYCSRLYIQPFLAMHFRTWEEHDWNIDQTYALGVEFGKIQGIGRKVRIFVEYHQGYCFEGQFLRERCDYSAIRLTWGF